MKPKQRPSLGAPCR